MTPRLPLLVLAPALATACSGSPVVVRVESGDTAVLDDGKGVRYAGVVAPAPGDPWFEASRRANADLVLDRRLTLLPAGGDASFVYTQVQFEGRSMLLFVQGELVRFGHVRAKPLENPGDHTQLYRDLHELEIEAQEFARGQWSPTQREDASHDEP